MTFKAIYEKESGIFRPVEPVDFPDRAEVKIHAEMMEDETSKSAGSSEAHQRIIEILSRSYDTGQTDTAARHNEHQP